MGNQVSLFVTCMVDQLFPKVGIAMADVLEARGYDYLHVEEANAQHDWQYWKGRFDELLEFLY